MVAHDLLADQVGLLDFGVEIDVFRQFRVVLVLLVVAVAVGIEGRGVERPTVVETVVEDELVVDLQIVVRLVVEIADVRSVGQYVRAGRGLVLAAVVVAAAVALHVLRHVAVEGMEVPAEVEGSHFGHGKTTRRVQRRVDVRLVHAVVIRMCGSDAKHKSKEHDQERKHEKRRPTAPKDAGGVPVTHRIPQ